MRSSTMIEINPLAERLSPLNTEVPGSKSYTNRAFLLAALAQGKSLIKGALESEDTEVMIKALISLGIPMVKTAEGYEVEGKGGHFENPGKKLDLANAGTAVRSLTAAAGLQEFPIIITGNRRMCERPIQDLIDALNLLGVQVRSQNGCPPVEIQGPMKGGETKVSGFISSQYLSALLMAAPYAQNPVTIKVKGHLTSLPYIQMTLETMKKFGVSVQNQDYQEFIIQPQQYQAATYTVEGDASSATYPLALAALHGGRVTITNIPGDSKQADILFLAVLEKMGCIVSKERSSITIEGTEKLKPLGEIDLNKLPDAAMTVAILCAFAAGKSKLTGLGNLRVKETDRIHALATELSKIGVHVQEGEDYLEIDGGTDLNGASIETYNDHRMAMCFGIAGSKIPGIKILNPECVQKTYPTFWEEMSKWGISLTKN